MFILEGTHNVKADYKNPAHIDAELTPLGIDQCRTLSKTLAETSMQVDCIVSSPMRRAIQTAHYSFQHVLDPTGTNDDYGDAMETRSTSIPFVACEEWRETVNYLCDQRLSKNQLANSYPHVDFDAIDHEHDPVWKYYEDKFGAHDDYTKIRESDDAIGLDERARAAWRFVKDRPEQSIAVVSHSAFFMHMFTLLDVVKYEDEEVELLMQDGFLNCEMRSVVAQIL